MTIQTAAASEAPARRFVPGDLDVADWARLEPLYHDLLDRPLDSPAELERWLADLSELSAVVREYGARRSIDQSCHTDDPEIENRYLEFITGIEPKIKPWFFKLQRKYIECEHHKALKDSKFEVLTREWRVDVELFREENVALEAEEKTLNNTYDKLIGAMLVEFQGRERTLQQMARYQEEMDREVREQAWRVSEVRRLADCDAIDGVFENMLRLRRDIAKNAGLPGYRDFLWLSWKRFDYTPEDCHRFADAIESACVPIVKMLNEKRRTALGVDRLRPWDMAVDPEGLPPLRPFPAEDVSKLISGCRDIVGRIDPSLVKDYDRLKPGRNLDLDSRKGKRAGGYQASLPEVRQPFIFMNAAGMQADVRTMLHEAGHAFHYMWSNHEPVLFLQHAPIEFCEVASMSMELFADDYLDVFYNDDESRRARFRHLEGIVRLFPWVATIDQFQHWLYTHPDHSHEERTSAWLRILDRFSDPAVDWTGLEEHRASMWQRQLHLFHVPFYYVEYAIAQLGALQIWKRYREDPKRALADYRAGLSLGGTRPLPELFQGAGIRFDFSEAVLRPLMEMVGEELQDLARSTQ